MCFPRKSIPAVRMVCVLSGLLSAWAVLGCCPDGTFPPCEVADGPTILVNETFNNDQLPYTRNFNPSAAAKLISATVSGDENGSRLQVTITDFGTGNVVAIELLPTTNTTTVSFVSTNNGAHVLTAVEAGDTGRRYAVMVTEQ